MKPARLNDFQREVLQWIADGCPEHTWPDSTHKISAVALQNRRLVSISKRRGEWTAEITDAGRLCLETGAYTPLRGTRASRAAQAARAAAAVRPTEDPMDESVAAIEIVSRPTTPPVSPAQRRGRSIQRPDITSPDAYARHLVAELRQHGGRARVSDSDAEALGPVFEAARTLGLLARREWLEADWRNVTLRQPPDPQAPARDVPPRHRSIEPHARLAASKRQIPALQRLIDSEDLDHIGPGPRRRALLFLQAIAVAAREQGHQVKPPTGHGQKRTHRGEVHHESRSHLALVICGYTVNIRVSEPQDRSPHVKTAKEVETVARGGYDWSPRYDYAPSGRIRLNYGAISWQFNEFTEPRRTAKVPEVWRLEQRLNGFYDAVLAFVAQRVIAAREQAERDREEALRHAARLARARDRFQEDWRAKQLEAQAAAWRHVNDLRDYIDAMSATAAGLDSEATIAAADRWIRWASEHADSLDPLRKPIVMPEVPDATEAQLRPFM